jgi:hypothetical protein
MKYTALLLIISGIVVACFAGVHYASGGADSTENPFVLGLALPLVLAVALVTTGTGLWAMGGRWSAVSGPAVGRHPNGAPGGRATADPSGE